MAEELVAIFTCDYCGTKVRRNLVTHMQAFHPGKYERDREARQLQEAAAVAAPPAAPAAAPTPKVVKPVAPPVSGRKTRKGL